MKTREGVNKAFDDILQELKALEEREKLRFLLDLADEIPEMDDKYRTFENKVLGCVSDVYVYARLNELGGLKWEMASGALLVKGFLAILREAFSNITPDVFLDSESILNKFVADCGLSATLVPSRANALGNIYKKMQEQVRVLKNF